MRPKLRHLLVLLALAIVAAVVALLLLRPPVAAPTADGQPPSAPTESGTSVPPADPDPWRSVAWQEVETPFVADRAPPIRIDGLIDGGELLIGWGRAPAPGNLLNEIGAVFISRDGRTWRTALIDDGVKPVSSSEIAGVAVGPRGLLAFGGVCCEPELRATWHSTDGVAWTRLEIGGELEPSSVYLHAVAGVEDGWVAVGNRQEGAGGGIWASDDGATWELVLEQQAGLPGATVADVAVTLQGVFAVGTVTGPDGTYDGAVWSSPDGRSWERVEAEDPALAGSGETRLSSIVAHAGGLFIGGAHGSTEERMRCEQLGLASTDLRPPQTATTCGWGTEHHWLWPDGRTWQRVDPADAPGEHPIEFRAVVAGGPGLVALGESSRPASPDTTLFTSADGLAWTPVPPPQPLGNGIVAGLIVRDRQVLAVADHFDGTRSEIRLWFGAAS